jgi:ribosome-binding factor A
MKDKKKGLFSDVTGAESTSEDGLDPREIDKRRQRERRVERLGQAHGFHKQDQFLSQVQSALEGALQSAANPILNSLIVEEIVPQGGALLVVVMLSEAAEHDVPAVTRALEEANAMLRREVAAAITRKETPSLSFVVLPPGAQKVRE